MPELLSDALRGRYNQTYVICKRESEESKEDDEADLERRVLFKCGTWCYTGNMTMDKISIGLDDLPRAIPTLQKQQNRLHYYCNASNIPKESPFFRPIEFVNEANGFASSELASDRVQDELARWIDTHEWLENDTKRTYFELKVEAPKCMEDVALAASKTYARGLIFITVYFENSFYVVLQDGEGDQPLLDVNFPDVSRPGRGIHVCSYSRQGGHDDRWRELSLWHSMEFSSSDDEDLQSTVSLKKRTANMDETVNLASDSYVQTYAVLKAIEEHGGVNPHHEVLFRFGSWCYNGSVQLTPTLELTDLPHIIPALRMQQSRLDYICDVTRVPVTSPFSKPLAYVSRLSRHIERELIRAEAVLEKLLEGGEADSSKTAWLESDSNGCAQSFFEFQLDLPPKLIDRHLKNIELIASKTYSPAGVVLVSVLFQSTLYVVVSDAAGEQPLLDSRFPDVTAKGKGFLVASHPVGVDGWPELRKVTVWQTAFALDLERLAASLNAAAKEGDEETSRPVDTSGSEDDDDGDDATAADAPAAECKGRETMPGERMEKGSGATMRPASLMSAKETSSVDENGHSTHDNSVFSSSQPKTSQRGSQQQQQRQGSKVNAPHRVPAIASLSEKLEKMREQLSGSGAEAPWDQFGRPKSSAAFKK